LTRYKYKYGRMTTLAYYVRNFSRPIQGSSSGNPRAKKRSICWSAIPTILPTLLSSRTQYLVLYFLSRSIKESSGKQGGKIEEL
jgi:hypothetical protein